MPIPIKSYRRQNLTVLEAIEGSHKISKVSFTEDGVKKIGFFKLLEPKNHFPELLAKISVAASELSRTFLGEFAAAERLVFDENDKIVGVLSIALENFKRFNYAGEPIPADLKTREQVVPSTKTLIEKDFISAAFTYWYLHNDDPHPGNNGFSGKANKKKASVLDYDMFFYWFTILMKGPRPGIGTPNKRIRLTVRDWETFLINRDSLFYHWCAYDHPGQQTLPGVITQGPGITRCLRKQFVDPTQFQRLASDAVAHDQKFARGMMALLTFQPQVERARLEALFADMPLNYTSLEETDVALRAAYELEYPELCNARTNIKPFVDFMMNLYQEHYDNLYRIIVFYMGCADNGFKVSLKATCNELYQKPSIFRNIEAWIREQNETLYKNEPSEVQFNQEELYRRYHQIWRDTYTPTLEELLGSCHKLINSLLGTLSLNNKLIREIAGKQVNDVSFTFSLQLLSSMPDLSRDKIESLISVDKESKYREGLLLFVDFTKKFHEIIEMYYGKKVHELTENDNLVFCSNLNKLHEDYDLQLRRSLLHTSSSATEYSTIAAALKQFIERVNFPRHLTTTDEQMKNIVHTTPLKIAPPHTDLAVIEQYNRTLFEWADSLKPVELTNHITNIIDEYYKSYSTTFTTRHRDAPVKEYLAKSSTVKGSQRLSYILSSVHDGHLGALNRLLIKHLTPLMLQRHTLPSIQNALRDDKFNLDLYTRSVVHFSKTDGQFINLNTTKGCELFYAAFYQWINNQKPLVLKTLIYSAISDYEKNSWASTFKSSIKQEIEKYIGSTMSQAQIVATIFQGREDQSTFSTLLFTKIVAKMKSDISKKSEKDEADQLIAEYNAAEHRAVEDSRKKYAEKILLPEKNMKLEYKNSTTDYIPPRSLHGR